MLDLSEVYDFQAAFNRTFSPNGRWRRWKPVGAGPPTALTIAEKMEGQKKKKRFSP